LSWEETSFLGGKDDKERETVGIAADEVRGDSETVISERRKSFETRKNEIEY